MPLCETTVRTGEALERLIELLHAAAGRRSMLRG